MIDPASPGGVRFDEAPEPQPTPSEALIAVEAFSLNHGELPNHGMFAPGSVPGWDSAGRVIAEAADGTGPKKGSRVVGIGANGAWAERRAVHTSNLAELPEGLSAAAASTLPVAAGTALRALRALGAILGRPVLVTGASGGVGQFAVPLARLGGAHVIALASSASKADALFKIGAHEVVTRVEETSVPVYGVIENVGGQVMIDCWSRMRNGGMLVSIGYASGEPASFPIYGTVGPKKSLVSFGLTDSSSGDEPLGRDLGYLAGLVADGTLDAPIVWEGHWERLGEAIELLDSRKISGKAVLTIP